jgi:hypothetical protein
VVGDGVAVFHKISAGLLKCGRRMLADEVKLGGTIPIPPFLHLLTMKILFCILLLTTTCGLSTAIGQSQGSEDPFKKNEAEVRRAVFRGLDFLISQEQPDGKFPDSHGKSTGISSLVGMACLSTGATPLGEGKYTEAVKRRIDYLFKNVDDKGIISCGDHGNGPMYAHNISSLFLSECSGMVDVARQKQLDEVLPKALKVILDSQAVKKDDRHQGGWRYQPNSGDSDMSCSGWALMAMHSARLNGAQVPSSAIDAAVRYVMKNQSKREGHIGYMDENQHKDSLTGAGLLCLELCGRHGTPETISAGEWILANHTKLAKAEHEMYGNYYNAQGMFQLGGKYWKTYAEWMYGNYLPAQKADGSWDGERFGKIYSTSMMVLALAVPFRQLPIYQRDERVDEE